jgi:hypothetical protein
MLPPRMRRWKRVEYERLVEAGVFRPGEPIELVGGQLVVHEPQGSAHYTAFGWRYGSVATFRAGDVVTPLAAPQARVAVADLLP